MYAHLECIDRTENCLRFYTIEVCKNLFGDWQLDRAWGRIGRSRSLSISLHGSHVDAILCAHGILAVKISRGYEPREVYFHDTNIISFLPRTRYAILDLKLCAFFAGHPRLQSIAIRMYSKDILYVGELIQLSAEQIRNFMPPPNGNMAEYFDELTASYNELRECLADSKLQLFTKIHKWRRPNHEPQFFRSTG